jgi:hypothetical protein
MTRSRIVRINRTLYALIPAEEARRLQLREGQEVDLEVAPAKRGTVAEVLALRGKGRGAFRDEAGADTWGD